VFTRKKEASGAGEGAHGQGADSTGDGYRTDPFQEGKRPIMQRLGQRRIVYWTATSLFYFMFLFSAVWTLVDPAGAIIETKHLGYPGFTVYPLAIAKLLGVVAIATNKSKTLKEFAFAGFLYDLILAVMGHYYQHEAKIGLALFGLVLWVCAFLADRYLREPGSVALVSQQNEPNLAERAA